jgi:hypothetical protein
MAFGHDVHAGPRGVRLHTLWVANDNDFIATIVDSHHPAGSDNPNQFFVFGIDPSALPDLERPHAHEH